MIAEPAWSSIWEKVLDDGYHRRSLRGYSDILMGRSSGEAPVERLLSEGPAILPWLIRELGNDEVVATLPRPAAAASPSAVVTDSIRHGNSHNEREVDCIGSHIVLADLCKFSFATADERSLTVTVGDYALELIGAIVGREYMTVDPMSGRIWRRRGEEWDEYLQARLARMWGGGAADLWDSLSCDFCVRGEGAGDLQRNALIRMLRFFGEAAGEGVIDRVAALDFRAPHGHQIAVNGIDCIQVVTPIVFLGTSGMRRALAERIADGSCGRAVAMFLQERDVASGACEGLSLVRGVCAEGFHAWEEGVFLGACESLVALGDAWASGQLRELADAPWAETRYACIAALWNGDAGLDGTLLIARLLLNDTRSVVARGRNPFELKGRRPGWRIGRVCDLAACLCLRELERSYDGYLSARVAEREAIREALLR
jgi:hypothetical protein